MSECYEHEQLRRQGAACPYCRIAELEAELQAAKTVGEALLEHSDQVESDNERLRNELMEDDT